MATKTERHAQNPFLQSMMIPIGKKSVQLSRLGKNDNVLIDKRTGEISGTHVVAHKKVDTEKFIKTFSDYMAFTFELTKSGNKALRIVMWAMSEQSTNKDTVILDKYTHKDFIEKNEGLTMSYTTFTRGLGELEKAKIIAKTLRVGSYFINPSCMFNGDRIAFTTLIERDNG